MWPEELAHQLDELGIVVVNYRDPVDGGDAPAVDLQQVESLLRMLLAERKRADEHDDEAGRLAEVIEARDRIIDRLQTELEHDRTSDVELHRLYNPRAGNLVHPPHVRALRAVYAAGVAAERERAATDAEVEAAARVITPASIWDGDPSQEKWREGGRNLARAALEAAAAIREGE